jgi:hypothetical protein
VIKNSHIRLRGGQRVPMSFKMKLPSTTKVSISSPAPKDTRIEWPVLSQIQSAKNKAVIPVSSEQDLSLTNSPGIQTQNSNIKMGHELSMHQGRHRRILIKNGEYKAWFYPSKGLNELFALMGGQPKNSDIKDTASLNPSPVSQPPSPPNTQQRLTYAEILKMASGHNKAQGHDDGREADGVRDRIASGNINSGNGVSGPMNPGTGAQRGFHPGRQHQVGFNPGHARGHPYGRKPGGWQRRPYGGYRYRGSRINNTDRGGCDHGAGQEIPQGNSGHVTHQIPIVGGAQPAGGLGQGAAGGGTTQQMAPDSTQEPHVLDLFKA